MFGNRIVPNHEHCLIGLGSLARAVLVFVEVLSRSESEIWAEDDSIVWIVFSFPVLVR